MQTKNYKTKNKRQTVVEINKFIQRITFIICYFSHRHRRVRIHQHVHAEKKIPRITTHSQICAQTAIAEKKTQNNFKRRNQKIVIRLHFQWFIFFFVAAHS